MATLRNTTGDSAGLIDINYQLVVRAAAIEQIPLRTYFSLSGAPGSWQFIHETANSGNVTLQLALPSWPAGAYLYLLWVDDNGSGSPDTAFGIDNFTAFSPGDPSPIQITNQPQDTVVAERGPAVFTVEAQGAPQYFSWYRDGVLIPEATGPTYTLDRVTYPFDNGARFQAVVTNLISGETSRAATLTVLPDTNGPTVVRAVGELSADTITLSFSEPLQAATINEGNFVLYERGTDPAQSPYVTFGAVLTDGTNVSLNTDPRDPAKNYSAAISQVRDASSQANLITPNPTYVSLRQVIQLIGFDTDNEWKYDINNGDRAGTGWETLAYDDSAWPSGAAALGLDASENGVPIRTPIPYQADGTTAYFRRRFFFPAATNGAVLRLRHVIDDGALFYLNGQHFWRYNMPSNVLFTTYAIVGPPDPVPISPPAYISPSNLLAGENVLAIEVHQSGSTSSDLVMAAELTSEIQTVCSCALRIVLHPESQTIPDGGNLTLRTVAEGAVPISYRWFKDGVALPGGTNATFTILGAGPADAGSYFMVASNSSNTATSQVAVVTVAPRLIVSRDATSGEVVITWRGAATLQETSALLDEGTAWTDVPANPNPLRLNPAGRNRFFRLRP